VQNLDPAYKNLRFDLDGKNAQDVYAMLIYGFSNVWIAGFYVVSMALLCWHLSHGVSSFFQSLGLRNEIWRKRLGRFALAYALIVFVGFIAVPVASVVSWYGGPDLVYASQVREATENWNGEEPIYVSYPEDAAH
jgi:succinate dehydrogenase / fumarate reductase cytochrome b subunit